MIGLNVTNPDDWASLPPEVTHLRIWDVGAHWGAIHTGPSQFDWGLLDMLVERAAGRNIVYTIGGTPRWLAKNPDQPHYAPWLGPGSNSIPWSVDEFNHFVWNLATRYKGRIKAYEVWNEPQLAEFLYPYMNSDVNALALMTKRAYRTIKKCDPAALVLAAPVLPRQSSGGMTRARRYLAALQRRGWNVDAFTCHIYPEAGYWGPRWASMLADVEATLKQMGAPTSRLWVTETLFGLLSPEITDAEALDAAVARAYRAADGKFVFWYGWDRKDLGGSYVGNGSPTWDAIKAHN